MCHLPTQSEAAWPAQRQLIGGCVKRVIPIALLTLAGCSAPMLKPSPLMQSCSAPVGSPPSDKTLVIFHRPRAFRAGLMYTDVWDSKRFIADIGSGNSAAYLCDPGTRYFINRSEERVGVTEAQLLRG